MYFDVICSRGGWRVIVVFDKDFLICAGRIEQMNHTGIGIVSATIVINGDVTVVRFFLSDGNVKAGGEPANAKITRGAYIDPPGLPLMSSRRKSRSHSSIRPSSLMSRKPE